MPSRSTRPRDVEDPRHGPQHELPQGVGEVVDEGGVAVLVVDDVDGPVGPAAFLQPQHGGHEIRCIRLRRPRIHPGRSDDGRPGSRIQHRPLARQLRPAVGGVGGGGVGRTKRTQGTAVAGLPRAEHVIRGHVHQMRALPRAPPDQQPRRDGVDRMRRRLALGRLRAIDVRPRRRIDHHVDARQRRMRHHGRLVRHIQVRPRHAAQLDPPPAAERHPPQHRRAQLPRGADHQNARHGAALPHISGIPGEWFGHRHSVSLSWGRLSRRKAKKLA